MSAKTNHFKLGLFVIAGLAILVGALFAFGARTWFEPRATFETYIEGDVEGLSVGSPVLLRGVAIGKVTRITFTWSVYPADKAGYVLVEFEIPASSSPFGPEMTIAQALEAQVKRGLRARIKGQGITGISIVAIDYVDPFLNPAITVAWTPRYHYLPSAPSQFSQVMSSIEKTLRNLEKINLTETVNRAEKALISMEMLATNLDGVVLKVGRLNFERLATNTSALVTEVRATNLKLQAFLDEARSSVAGADFPALTKKADALMARLTETSEQLRAVLSNLDTSTFNDTLANARSATGELDAVLRELKQYPSGFLFGRPPPPAKSVKPSPK
jgi:phospholipid/cholesterol/gamma-HCH transport system substrate-binding protein